MSGKTDNIMCLNKDDREEKAKKINKKIRSRITKKEQYKKERKELLDKLNNILGITDKNKRFVPDSFSDDVKSKLDNIVDDVKKYFKSSKWAYFCKEIENKYLSLVRSIYKDEGYTVLSYRNNLTGKSHFVVEK